MYEIEQVIADGHYAGYKAATEHLPPIRELWVDAVAAWHTYWERPEIADLPSGHKGTAGCAYMVAYAAGRTQQTYLFANT